ncbi:MAG: Ger(x)C family spore germination protein [Lachnospiraceae bacterium]|nr:Ger(x)C family spore germination protein [Lachnospiraceae bacterium]
MNKKIIILSVFCMVLLCGCYDSKEIDERNFVISVGIDKGDNGKIEVALGIAKPDTKSESSVAEEIKTIEGNTFAQALKLTSSTDSQSMYFGHTKNVVFGNEILKDSNAMEEILDTMVRNNDFSLKIIMLSSKGNAKDCIELVEKSDNGEGLYIWDFYKNNANETEATTRLELKDMEESFRLGNSVVIPIISVEADKIVIGGGAVADKNGLVGYLDDDEMEGYLWVAENCTGHMVQANSADELIPIAISKSDCKVDFKDDGKLICNIKIDVRGNVEGHSKNYNAENVRKALESVIKQQISTTINKAQVEYKTDIFGMTEKISKKNEELYNKYGEEDCFNAMEFNVEVNGKITGTGIIS